MYKIRKAVPELGIISPVVIVVINISWPLILGMDLLQIYRANVDARTMQVTWAHAGADKRAEIVLTRQTFSSSHGGAFDTHKMPKNPSNFDPHNWDHSILIRIFADPSMLINSGRRPPDVYLPTFNFWFPPPVYSLCYNTSG